MSREEFYTAGTFVRVMNLMTDEGEEPFDIDWPWSEPPEPDVTEEERTVLVARLKASSAFGQFRT